MEEAYCTFEKAAKNLQTKLCTIGRVLNLNKFRIKFFTNSKVWLSVKIFLFHSLLDIAIYVSDFCRSCIDKDTNAMIIYWIRN